MRLLQFSTSHYCRKARLILGYKKITYDVENLTPGVHILRVKPLTGGQTVPVLLSENQAIGDSTEIWHYLEKEHPDRTLILGDRHQQQQAELLEDWLDESLGVATRFIYYHYRSGEGKSIDPSWFSQAVIQIVKKQYNISLRAVSLASQRLELGLKILGNSWQHQPYLVSQQISIADIAAAALLSPLALIPHYRTQYPWLFQRIEEIHQLCGEALPPGLGS
ncbi:MAG: glutathione S-transferase [Roseofilum sp. SBFL]|uniref:glutathione S-transferase n=1 Tax=unclassified Roseofilum TaxID=2620099 RepID=UPI001B2D6EA4|nr:MULTISPECIES: glutathione S-transferase [unclassified Roseofilum]MBP0013339.1 glutathione S-transferase [Roseofilum sp. SID3]MBP0023972.1 glutathione S-transferase [Roseofilum sp. SID2]MBP0039176.1 glutathione S-transferase [Roseofilum sp. SID1]MBP0043310.1 glutathione S-transferase [Roseofilum sp. SBFL]